MESMLHPLVLILVIAAIVMGMIILFVAVAPAIYYDMDWFDAKVGQALSGTVILMLSFSIILATTHFSTARDYVIVLGMIVLTGGGSIFFFVLKQAAHARIAKELSYLSDEVES